MCPSHSILPWPAGAYQTNDCSLFVHFLRLAIAAFALASIGYEDRNARGARNQLLLSGHRLALVLGALDLPPQAFVLLLIRV
jgi:hypothetical protein